MYSCLYQHERRWIVVGWKPANKMLTLKGKRDPPHWSDARGEEVGADAVDRAAGEGWEPIVVEGTTDSKGWTYAFDFDGIDVPREGGRAKPPVS